MLRLPFATYVNSIDAWDRFCCGGIIEHFRVFSMFALLSYSRLVASSALIEGYHRSRRGAFEQNSAYVWQRNFRRIVHVDFSPLNG
jgi:hypothetical protein